MYGGLAGHFLRPIEDYLADENGLALLLAALLFKPFNSSNETPRQSVLSI